MTAQVVVFTCYFAAWLGVPNVLGSGVQKRRNVGWDEEIKDNNIDAPVPSLQLQIVHESP
jgi:hypothetical protein